MRGRYSQDDRHYVCSAARRVGFDYRATKILAEYERPGYGKKMVKFHIPRDGIAQFCDYRQ